MVKRFRRGRASSFPKRSTLWVPFDELLAFTTSGTTVRSGNLLSNYFGQTGEEVPIGSTVGPVRGKMRLAPNVTSVTDSLQGIEMALQVVPEGGRTQAPVPGTDIMDAMWYGQLFASAVSQETASGVFGGPGLLMDFNTKAKRKITGNGQELILSGQVLTNADYNLRVFGVLMIMLP